MIRRFRREGAVTKFSSFKGWELAQGGGENFGEGVEGLKQSFRIMKDGNDFFFVRFFFFHGTNSSTPLHPPLSISVYVYLLSYLMTLHNFAVNILRIYKQKYVNITISSNHNFKEEMTQKLGN